MMIVFLSLTAMMLAGQPCVRDDLPELVSEMNDYSEQKIVEPGDDSIIYRPKLNCWDDSIWYRFGSSQTFRWSIEAKAHLEKDIQLLPLSKQHLSAPVLPRYELKSLADNLYQLRVLELPEVYDRLLVAVWSQRNGQDDLMWYQVKRQPEQPCQLIFEVREPGRHELHLYGQRKDNQTIEGILPTRGFNHELKAQPLNSYPQGQCTWGVKVLAPWVGDYWGNAKEWITNAQMAGFQVSSQAIPGAIAVWPKDGRIANQIYGHVAYVTEVDQQGHIKVLEANFNGNSKIADYRGFFDPKAEIWGGQVYYIYPKTP